MSDEEGAIEHEAVYFGPVDLRDIVELEGEELDEAWEQAAQRGLQWLADAEPATFREWQDERGQKHSIYWEVRVVQGSLSDRLANWAVGVIWRVGAWWRRLSR